MVAASHIIMEVGIFMQNYNDNELMIMTKHIVKVFSPSGSAIITLRTKSHYEIMTVVFFIMCP